MVTPADLISLARTFYGLPYNYGIEVDLTDPNPVALDCSEKVQLCCALLSVSPTVPDGSWLQYRHCHNYGLAIPIQQAIDTPAALLFRFSDDPLTGGRPTSAHVAISNGDGTTSEARSTAYGVGTWSAYGRGWTHAALIPGIDYEGESVFTDTEIARLKQIVAADDTDLTTVGQVFHDDWQWAKTEGVVTEHSQPTDLMSKQEYAAFARRYDRDDMAAIADLYEQVGTLRDRLNAILESPTTVPAGTKLTVIVE